MLRTKEEALNLAERMINDHTVSIMINDMCVNIINHWNDDEGPLHEVDGFNEFTGDHWVFFVRNAEELAEYLWERRRELED